jgi:ketosteroid isomerase-like protein
MIGAALTHLRRAEYGPIAVNVVVLILAVFVAYGRFFVVCRLDRAVCKLKGGLAMTEALIRERIEDLVKALNAKDIDGVISLFAPNLVSFDIAPHFGALRYFGAENKRRAWQEAFATFSGPFSYELHELNVTTQGEELAFVHSLNHVRATLASAQISELWVRWTACFRRIDGVWLIVHDHVSVPADLEHGRAVLNLTP